MGTGHGGRLGYDTLMGTSLGGRVSLGYASLMGTGHGERLGLVNGYRSWGRVSLG